MPTRPNDSAPFHALHAGPDLLILANAWDAFSARLIVEAGAKAIATSSAAVAWAHGYADGHHLPVALLVQTVEEIARVVTLPITADAEGGYADDPASVGENIAAIVGAGAVGINIEDGVAPADLLCRKIEAARAAAERAGVNLFINARCDVYLKRLAEGEAALAETLARGKKYAEAGASGLFVPGPTDGKIFETVARAIDLPLNVMSRKGLPPLPELKRLGVRRLSAATGIVRTAYAAARQAAEAFVRDGESDALAAVGGPPTDYNALFVKG